jgi:hypothetical protein
LRDELTLDDVRGRAESQSLRNLVTPKQLKYIRDLARARGVDADEECKQELNCKCNELSKRAASAFINYLKGA